jgi:hypothetical protein
MCFRKVFNLILILVFVFGLTNIDVLFSIDSSQIVDRQNYLQHVINAENFFFRALNYGFPLFFIFEPLYFFIVYLITLFQFSPEITIKILIFISAFFTIYTLYNKSKISLFWIIVISLTPFFLANYIMTLRQGLAFCFFLLGHFYFKDWRKYFFILLSPLVHYLFYIVIVLYLFSNIIHNKNKFNIKYVLFFAMIFSCLISLTISNLIYGIGLDKLNSYVDENQGGVLGFGLLFWFVILVLFYFEGSEYLRNNLFSILLIVFYLGSVTFFSPLSRVLQATSPIVFLSGFKLTKHRNILFRIMLICFAFYILAIFYFTKSLGSMGIN